MTESQVMVHLLWWGYGLICSCVGSSPHVRTWDHPMRWRNRFSPSADGIDSFPLVFIPSGEGKSSYICIPGEHMDLSPYVSVWVQPSNLGSSLQLVMVHLLWWMDSFPKVFVYPIRWGNRFNPSDDGIDSFPLVFIPSGEGKSTYHASRWAYGYIQLSLSP